MRLVRGTGWLLGCGMALIIGTAVFHLRSDRTGGDHPSFVEAPDVDPDEEANALEDAQPAAPPFAAISRDRSEPRADEPQTRAEPAFRDKASPPADGPAHRHLLRSWTGKLEPSLREIAAAYRENELAGVSLPTFEGGEVFVRIRGVRDHPLGGVVLSGEVEGEPAGNVTLAEVDGAASGSIRLPKQNLVYEIRPTGDGTIAFGEVDLKALGECARCAEGAIHPAPRSEDR